MALSKAIPIELPAAFDTATYDGLSTRAARFMAPPSDAYSLFATAWNGVGYRITAAVRYDEEFRAALASGGTGPAGEDRFIQERALFGCVGSALSAIDCCSMACYAIGGYLRPAAFPVDDAKQLKKYPPDVARTYRAEFEGAPITKMLSALVGSNEYDRVKGVRDVLSHRGALPRSHFVSLGGDGKGTAKIPGNPRALARDFDYATDLDDNTTRVYAEWTVATLNQLLKELSAFAPQ